MPKITYSCIGTYNFVAHDDDKHVGSLELITYEGTYDPWHGIDDSDRTYLSSISVLDKYQRQGIGTALIQLALENHPDLMFPNFLRTSYKDDDLWLTSDGDALMYSCLGKGIITEKNIANPSRLNTYAAEEKEDDGTVKDALAVKAALEASAKEEGVDAVEEYCGL